MTVLNVLANNQLLLIYIYELLQNCYFKIVKYFEIVDISQFASTKIFALPLLYNQSVLSVRRMRGATNFNATKREVV